MVKLKYMHTPVEMLCMEDVENLSKLLAKFICGFGKDSEALPW